MKTKVIDNIHDLILELKKNPTEIYLSKELFNFLFNSKWKCVLTDKVLDYLSSGGIICSEK